jgi:beta-phosphoglucomutase-like phosphatase (HAD superfamily)
MNKHLIIFDFDGVIADSELIANTALAETLTAFGLPTTLDQSYDRYMGKRKSDSYALIEAALGKPLPAEFEPALKSRSGELFKTLQPVQGVGGFIDTFKHHARAVASSSNPDYLARSLTQLELAGHFGPNVFSATMVARGKPDPDIFLWAADRMRAHPDQCIVIEDSTSGVRAGRAAGMTTIGLLAGSHIRNGHREQLLSAGASHIAADYTELTALMHRLEVS